MSLFSMEIELTSNDLLTLEKFANSEYGNVQDAHAIISHMVKYVVLTGTGGYTSPTLNDDIRDFLGGNINVFLVVSTSFNTINLTRPKAFSLNQESV